MTKKKQNDNVEGEATKEQEVLREVAKSIEKVLLDSGMALHPYLDFSENAIRPSVRLVKRVVGDVTAEVKE